MGKRKTVEQTSATLGSRGAPKTIDMASAASLHSTFSALSVGNAIPEGWDARARKAVEYYQQEPIVSNAINTWRTFAVGDEIGIVCDDEKLQDEAIETFWRLNLNQFVKDMILQLLVKGEAVGYMDVSTSDVNSVVCVNPISMRYEFDAHGVLTSATQVPTSEAGSTSGGDEIALDLERMFRRKWNAPEFEMRGTSMVLPAFEAIELLRDYRRAERAIAKRWTTPLRFIQVGGAYGNRIIQPDQRMLEKIRDEIEKTDLKSGLVVPFYVKAETYGADGTALDTESKIAQTKEDILVALGMAKSLISGDGPNFATASVSMQKMIVQLKEIKQVARDILDWVFDEWLKRRGLDEDSALHYSFNDIDMSNEIEQRKLLVELYDRGLISRETLQKKCGLAPDVEVKQRDGEATIVDSNWTIQDITQLVTLEVLTPDEARALLRIGGKDKPTADEAHKASRQADVERIYERVNAAGRRPKA